MGLQNPIVSGKLLPIGEPNNIVSTSFKIEISDEPNPDIVHRFRNFGEDVYGALREHCTVSLDEIDRATTSFVIREVRKRDRSLIAATIARALRRHHFEATGSCTRVPNP